MNAVIPSKVCTGRAQDSNAVYIVSVQTGLGKNVDDRR
jgi:hypothetical protein